MKTILITILSVCLFASPESYSQQTYVLDYVQIRQEKKFSFPIISTHPRTLKRIGYIFPANGQLAFNDSLAFYYFLTKSEKCKIVNISNSRKICVHHAVVSRKNDANYYNGVQRKDSVKLMYPIPLKNIDFKIDSSVVYHYLGHKCFVARGVSEGEEHFALLATDMQYPFGPVDVKYPYLCLQYYSSKYNRVFVAVELKETNEKLFFPKILPIEKR